MSVVSSRQMQDSKYELTDICLSGSMIPGWQSNAESDLILRPDLSWSGKDPFSAKPRHLVFSNVIDPFTPGDYKKDTRAVAGRLENYLQKSQVADKAVIGPELEFYLFDNVRFVTNEAQNLVELGFKDGWPAQEANPVMGHSVGHPSMHFGAAPIDKYADVRDEMLDELATLDVRAIHHVHESGPSQQELGVMHQPLLKSADTVQLQKYVVKNVAARHGLSATFMPTPMAYTAGNGMHVNLSLWHKGRNVFHDQANNGLTTLAKHFIAGVLCHIKALNAITNPSTNSYRRLSRIYSQMSDSGYGYRNRSMEIRIPHFKNSEDCRIEIRFPDCSSNPYLAFSALVLAGLDGIEKEMQPPEPVIINPQWYERPFDSRNVAPKTLARDLYEAVQALHSDRDFLKKGDVFSDELIDSLIDDANFFLSWHAAVPNPVEMQVFYSI